MQIRYIGSRDPTEHEICTVFGETFEKNRWHKLQPHMGKLVRNPMFEARDEPKTMAFQTK